MDPEPITFDVSARFGEPTTIAGTVFAAEGAARHQAVLVCLPGGTYTRGYWDLEVPGHEGYSFARAAAGAGFTVVTLDGLGTGESSRPAREVDLAAQAEAAAAVVTQLPAVLGREAPVVAVGHSMGGYLALAQQAGHRSYAGLAILGTTNLPVVQLDLPPELVAAAATPEGRAAVIDQIASAVPDPYVEADRTPMRSWFHLEDVPTAVIEADDASTLTVVPRRCAAESSTPGVTLAAAEAVQVPVFLAYGEVDVSPDPHADAACYRGSSDVTLYLLAGSAHCHNMASTRQRLWDRLLDWCGSAIRS
jgi:pimeloyl-ACP methyl ester carboxylesterase